MGFIFDINEYGVLSLLLENDLENVLDNSFGYINVGGGGGKILSILIQADE